MGLKRAASPDRVCAALAALVLMGTCTPALALVVDTFEDGPFAFVASHDTTDITQIDLDPAEVLSGSRRSGVASPFGEATAELITTDGDDALTIVAEDWVQLGLVYDPPPLGVDLTDGGSADRLRIEVAAATTPLELRVGLESLVESGGHAPVVDVTGLGAYEIPFEAFGFSDPGALASVVVLAVFLSLPSSQEGGTSFALADIRTVPEPATSHSGMFATLALAAGAARRKPCRNT